MKNISTKPVAQVILTLIISFAVIYFSNDLSLFFGRFMYVGIFALSFFAHATIFVPSFLFQIGMISIAKNLNPIFFGIFAGIGSSIGELNGYFLGRGSSGILENKLTKNIVDIQHKIIKLHPEIAIFLLSAIPNPFFDFAGILSGFLKIKLQRFLLVCSLGRIIRYIAIGYLGLWAVHLI